MSMGTLLMPSVLFANAMGTVNVESLNVRKAPSTSSAIVTQIKTGEKLEILEASQGWYKVKLSNGQLAYVKDDYLEITEVQGTVNTNNLNLRSYPHLSKSRIMSKLPKDVKVKILYQVDDFYKIAYNGQIGFVYASYIDVPFNTYVLKQKIEQVKEIPVTNEVVQKPVTDINKDQQTGSSKDEIKIEENEAEEDPVLEEESSTETKEENQIEEVNKETIGIQLANYALKFLGNPYKYGGNDLLTGVDCSGFTQQVMKQFGITIPRTSQLQSTVGQSIAKVDIKQGDLIFFGATLSSISHVGIYIGEGKMIHSSTPATGIIISSAFNSGGNPMQVIRRMY